MMVFESALTNETSLKPTDFKGRVIVSFSYPKDTTPSCSADGQQPRHIYDHFLSPDIAINPMRSTSALNFTHCHSLALRSKNIGSAHALSNVLENTIPRAKVGTIVSNVKNLYGKQVRGIERSTFVIDANGVIRREWRGVKVIGHAQEVLDFIKTL